MTRGALFGGNGYLGSQLAAYLTAQGTEFDVFDIPTFDVTRTECWESFKAGDYSTILFFAGMTGTEKSFTDAERFLDVNEHGLLNLLTRLVPLGSRAPKIIFPSTRLVYRGADYPLTEDAPKEAKTVYAVNKLACEYLLHAYHVHYGIPYVVLRICVPYGSIVPHDYSYGTIGMFIRQAKERGEIQLYGGGVQCRTFTSAPDICRIVLKLALGNVIGIFNIGGESMSLYEAATLVVQKIGGVVRSVPWPASALALESGSTVFDYKKLNVALGSEIKFEKMSDYIEHGF